MESENTLKVGEKVCSIHYHRHSDKKSYNFSEVERLTATRAVLKNGVVLVNKPCIDYYKNEEFRQYGESAYSGRWQRATASLIEEAKVERHKSKVETWFSNKKFSFDEKEAIYNLFSNQNHKAV